MINKIRNIDKINLVGLIIVSIFILPLLTIITFKVLTTSNIIF